MNAARFPMSHLPKHRESALRRSAVVAWLMTLANLCEVDMEKALAKYAKGCSGCGQIPCACRGEKP